MKHVYYIVIVAFTGLATPALAEGPRILKLQGASEATLPGDHDGAKHGVTVRRGSGFPEPIVVEAPAIVEEAPAPAVRKKTKTKRRYGW